MDHQCSDVVWVVDRFLITGKTMTYFQTPQCHFWVKNQQQKMYNVLFWVETDTNKEILSD